MDTKPWLNELSWDALQHINQSLCDSQQVPVLPGKNLDKARLLWEQARSKPMDLASALDVCRECTKLSPFTFNNGNTFATVSRRLVGELMSSLPSYEEQLLRDSIGHYVNGKITKQEFLATLRYAETTWRTTRNDEYRTR